MSLEEEISQLNLVVLEGNILDIVYDPPSNPFIFVSKVLILLKKHGFTPSDKLKSYIHNQVARGYSPLSFAKYQKLNFGDTIYQYEEYIRLVR